MTLEPDGIDEGDPLSDRVEKALGALSGRIAVLRAEAKLTQRELARRAGWSQSNVSKLERGEHRPGVDIVLRLQYALQLSSVEQLFGELERAVAPSARLLEIPPSGDG
jgi:transcriptional regulator with XRE-family HTH domain